MVMFVIIFNPSILSAMICGPVLGIHFEEDWFKHNINRSFEKINSGYRVLYCGILEWQKPAPENPVANCCVIRRLFSN